MQLSLIRPLKVEGVCMSGVNTFIVWLHVVSRVGKINQILRCDWLPEMGNMGLSCPLRILVSSTAS